MRIAGVFDAEVGQIFELGKVRKLTSKKAEKTLGWSFRPLAETMWLLNRSPNILLIPGTSSVAHLRENIAAGQLTLSPQALAALDGIAAAH